MTPFAEWRELAPLLGQSSQSVGTVFVAHELQPRPTGTWGEFTVRDSIIAVLLIGSSILGLMALKRYGVIHPMDVPAPSARAAKKPSFSKNKGVIHDEAANQLDDSTDEGRGQSQGSEVSGSENQELTSIYEEVQSPESGSAVSTESSVEKGKRKSIHGVPIQSWLASRRNAIPLSEEAVEEDQRLRVYLQCLELKSGGPQYVGKKECQRLFARPESEPQP